MLKLLGIAVAGLLLAVTLVACGGGSGGSGSSGGGDYGSSGAATPNAGQAAPADAVKVSLVDFKINPSSLTAKAGDVSFAVSNDGKSPHNLTIFDADKKVLAKTADLAPGKSEVLKVKLAAGTYHINCSEPGHESLGMGGMLMVS